VSEKRSRTIGVVTQKMLWGVAAGRCEFQGCNKLLFEHSITKDEGNFAENAHMEAVSEGGARYKEYILEEDLNSIDNLMLLCAGCHKYIDENEEDYPVEILKDMKKKHEDRVRIVTEDSNTLNSVMINYFANIKDVNPVYNDVLFRRAVIRNRCVPVDKYSIAIGSDISILNDGSKEYYMIQNKQLEENFIKKIKPTLVHAENVAVFALAPQPLLIKLGYLMSDIRNVSVYQCHRDYEKWSWHDTDDTVEYRIQKENENNIREEVAINISLSTEIINERIWNVTDVGMPMYTIIIDEPNRNFVTNQAIVDEFVKCFRKCVEMIKNDHQNVRRIKIFSAMPNSLAVRLGMDIMPKTDPIFEIYDQISQEVGFMKTLEIGGEI
jgi:hypothetical protein